MGIPAVDNAAGEKLLGHADVEKVIRAVLKSCGCRDDVDNLVGDVVRKALELSRKDPDPPRTVDRWKAIVRDVAYKTGLDDRKKTRVRERAHGEKVTEHETVAASVASSQRDPIDLKRAMTALRDMPKPEGGEEILDAVQSGDGASEAGRELNIGERRAHKILKRMRENYLKIGGVASLMVAATLLILWIRGDSASSLLGGGNTTAQVAPRVRTLEPRTTRPSASGLADQARDRAAMECQAGQWDQCAEDLQVALQLDPALAIQTDFQRLQQQMTDGIYEQGREMSAKPGEYPQKK